MSNFFKSIRRAKVNVRELKTKTDLFGDLVCAIDYINPQLTDEQQIFIAHTSLLAIVDINDLRKIVSIANKEAQKKFDEVSVLHDMVNSPTATNNNN